MAGLQHPWMGADHIAAMLAAGLWAAQLGNRSIPPLLCATVVGIFGGTVFGVLLAMPTVAEQVTASSAVALGLLAAAAAKPRLPAATTLIVLFCFFHGYIHATETPRQFSQLDFTGGFAFSMLILQLVGATIAVSLSRRTVLVSTAGACCAIAGAVVLLG
jgi:urease accessory protein